MDDLISRLQAINVLEKEKPTPFINEDGSKDPFGMGRQNQWYRDGIAIMRLPSVQPERKRGGWIKMSDSDGIYFTCSICGENLPRVIQRFDPQFDLFPRLESIDKTNYCPNCGADMRGEANDCS